MNSGDDICPGCLQKFETDAITGVLPNPQIGMGPKRRWHIHCHQKEYYRSMEREAEIRNERFEMTGRLE
jgi:hypothetical protein